MTITRATLGRRSATANTDGTPSEPAIRTGRVRELILLALATALSAVSYASVEWTLRGELPSNYWAFVAGFAAVGLLGHLAIRWLAPYADPTLLPLALAINGMGLTMIHRLDLARQIDARVAGKDIPGAMVTSQVMWTVIGVVAMAGILWLLRDHRILARYTYTSILIGIGLLFLPLVPGIGVAKLGARIWISVAGFSGQPGEFAKLILAVGFSAYLVTHREGLALAGRHFLGIDLPRGRDLGPLLTLWAIGMGILVFENDLGTTALVFGTFVVLLFVATERPGWLFLAAGLGVVGLLAAYKFVSHVAVRVDGWLDPFSDTDRFYQIIQSLYGLAYGGMTGAGWGNGYPQTVPFAESDFIISALGEELGLTGLLALLLAYGILIERGLRAALIVRDPFGKLLATALSASMCMQVFVVVGGVTKLIPLTGLTAPFLAAGGSSLVANWILIGLLLRISNHGRQPAKLPSTGTPRVVITPDEAPAAQPDAATSAIPAVPRAATDAPRGGDR